MKKYICMLLTFGMLLTSLVRPQEARADSAYDNFTWTLIAEAGTALDEEEDIIPAVCLYFAECSDSPDYVEVYRGESEDGDFFQIGVYEYESAEEGGCFRDSAVKLGRTYYYCAAAGWYAEGENPGYTSGISNIVSCTVYLGKPQVETVTSGKGVRILLPESEFVDSFRYVAVQSAGIYTTGFQIYRSRKEASGYKLIASVTADEESYKDTSVTRGKLYFYKVRAFYYDKEEDVTYTGPFSDIRMCCPGSKNFPDADGLHLTAVWKSAVSAKVSWNRVDGFVAETLCYVKRKAGEQNYGKPEFVDLSKKAESCTLKELEEGYEYEFRLLVRVKTPYNDGNDNFYYDSRWYVCTLEE